MLPALPSVHVPSLAAAELLPQNPLLQSLATRQREPTEPSEQEPSAELELPMQISLSQSRPDRHGLAALPSPHWPTNVVDGTWQTKPLAQSALALQEDPSVPD